MRIVAALFNFWLIAAAPALAGAATQPLTMTVHGNGATATRLPQYDPTLPIAVTVTNTGIARLDALSIVARDPAGEAIRTSLVRASDGTFSGTLTLASAGYWQLILTSRVGPVSTDTTAVDILVTLTPPSNGAWIGLLVGGGMFVIVGGSGFLLLRRLCALGEGANSAGHAAQ